MPGLAGVHVRIDFDDIAASDLDSGDRFQESYVGMLTRRQHQRVGLQALEPAGADSAVPVGCHLHLFDHDLVAAELLHGGHPPDLDALGEGFRCLVRVRSHVLPVGAIDQHRFLGTKAFGDARDVDCGVAGADDAHHPTEPRCTTLLDLFQQSQRVDHLAAVHRRNVEVVAHLRADREERGVEIPRLRFGEYVVDAVVARDRHAHRLDALDLFQEAVAGQAIRRDAVMHHAARLGARIADFHVMSHAPQVIRAGQATGSGADDQNSLARWRLRGDLPVLGVGEIAQKPIQRMDRDRLVQMLAIA